MIITFSGIDGSGKSTAAVTTVKSLKAIGIDATLCIPRYLSNDVIKRYCEKSFGDPYSYVPNVDPTFYVCCLISDWLDLLNTELCSHEGRVVVCDRYIFDVLAQGIHIEADVSPLLSMIPHFPSPDISFLIELTPQEAHGRLQLRINQPIHHLESLPNLQKLNDAYKRTRELIGWNPTVLTNDVINDARFVILAKLKSMGLISVQAYNEFSTKVDDSPIRRVSN